MHRVESDIRRRMLCIAIAAAAALATFVATAQAAGTGCNVSVTKIDTTRFPVVRAVFTKDCETSKLPEISIRENDRKVSGVNVYGGKPGVYESNPNPAISIVLDTSLTMKSPKIDFAIEAANALVAQAKEDDRVGLVTFGGEAELLQEPTSSRGKILEAVKNSSKLEYGTELFDGIITAIDSMPNDATRRIVVVLGDGQDISSKNDVDDVISAAREDGVEIYTVGLRGKVFDPQPLQKMSSQTGAEFSSVGSAQELEGLFDKLGQQLLRGYWLEFRSAMAPSKDVKVVLSVEGGEEAVASFRTPAPKGGSNATAVIPEPKNAKPDNPLIPLPGNGIGIFIAALPFAAMIALFVFGRLVNMGRPDLAKRVDPYTKQQEAARLDRRKSGKRAGEMLAPAMTIAEGFLGRSSLFNHYHHLLEMANLPLRAVELLFMNIAGGLFGVFFGLVVFGGGKIGLPMLVLGPLAPYLWVRLKARKRRKLFEEQLADVLSSVASSLKAGHSFNQAIAAVIKESPDPTAEEFKRAMTEARLGMPLEDALEAMAKRLGSQDFDFVVTTVNIQRTVGGSLAEILDMVGDTVRGRQQFRKKVKALTSMGTASAYVLLGMPFFMGGVLTLMKPDYMEPLFHTPTGHKMIMAGCFFMTLGYFACMKVVKVKV